MKLKLSDNDVVRKQHFICAENQDKNIGTIISMPFLFVLVLNNSVVFFCYETFVKKT